MPTRRYKFFGSIMVIAFFGFLVHHVREWFASPVATTVLGQSQHAPPVDTGRQIAVQLTTATANANPFLFYSNQDSIAVHPGEPHTVNFYVKNLSDRVQEFRAIPYVAPEQAARFLQRTAGFGEKIVSIQPGQIIKLPMSFYIDAELPQSVDNVTLNYTLYLLNSKGEVA